jgi:hypothetical protein
MRNSSVERTWTVSDCKWICVEGGLCVILSFERFKNFPTHNCASLCVIHESACVVYASSMRDYARYMRRPSVLMRWNWFESAHVHVRPLTPHFHITHELRTYHVHSNDNHLQSVKCSRSVRVWTHSVSNSCVGRASDVRGILHRIACMRRCARYVSDSSVIVSEFMLIRQ